MPTEFFERKLFLFDDGSIELPQKAEKLLEHQLENWKLASDGYRSLKSIRVKRFEFDGFSVEAHFNPGRIISSSAKVDAKSIEARPCFLCVNNLPADQKAVKIFDDFILLINPYPIFDKHFTIPITHHIPQAIKTELGNMMEISFLLGENFSVFYNGPRCGASAPDHLHFQAGNFGFMNIDHEFNSICSSYGKVLIENENIIVRVVTGCLRNFFSIESKDISAITEWFNKIYEILDTEKSDTEPMLNIICNYNDGWRLLIFPRTKHRPTYFFEEGEGKVLISPAAVDLGGVLIFPREENFNKITRELIADIFAQVTFNDDEIYSISDKLLSEKS